MRTFVNLVQVDIDNSGLETAGSTIDGYDSESEMEIDDEW